MTQWCCHWAVWVLCAFVSKPGVKASVYPTLQTGVDWSESLFFKNSSKRRSELSKNPFQCKLPNSLLLSGIITVRIADNCFSRFTLTTPRNMALSFIMNAHYKKIAHHLEQQIWNRSSLVSPDIYWYQCIVTVVHSWSLNPTLEEYKIYKYNVCC